MAVADVTEVTSEHGTPAPPTPQPGHDRHSRAGDRGRAAVVRWAPFILLAAVMGGVLGWWHATGQPTRYRAAATVRIDRDPYGSLGTTVTRPQLEARAADFEAGDALVEAATMVGADPFSVSVDAALDVETALVTVTITADGSVDAVAVAGAFVDIVRDRSRADQVEGLEHELEQARHLAAVNAELLVERVQDLRALRGAGLDNEAAAVELLMWHTNNRHTSYEREVVALEADISLAEGRVEVLDLPNSASAEAPAVAVEIAGGALIAGALAAGATALLAGRRDEVLTADELTALSGVPVIAAVPEFGRRHRNRESALVVADPAASNEAEPFRFARNTLFGVPGGPRTVAVTSPGAGAGKTVVAANLAAATAASGTPTMLVDGDLLSSTSAEALGLVAGVNALPHVLAGADVGAAVTGVRVGGGTVDYLGARGLEPWSGARPELTVGTVRALFAGVADGYDAVVLDCPPLLAVGDALSLCAAADGTVLVVRVGTTTLSATMRSIRLLESAGAKILGIITTCAPEGAGWGEGGAAGRISTVDRR